MVLISLNKTPQESNDKDTFQQHLRSHNVHEDVHTNVFSGVGAP